MGMLNPVRIMTLTSSSKFAYPAQDEDLHTVESANIHSPFSQKAWTYRKYCNGGIGGVAPLFWKILTKDRVEAERLWGVSGTRMPGRGFPMVYLGTLVCISKAHQIF